MSRYLSHLYPRLRQADLFRQPLSGEHVWIVGPLKLCKVGKIQLKMFEIMKLGKVMNLQFKSPVSHPPFLSFSLSFQPPRVSFQGLSLHR